MEEDRNQLIFFKWLLLVSNVFSSCFQEEYRKLEVLAFEMETAIGSLEEKLATANEEKEQAVLNSERLVLEIQDLSEKLNFSNSELQALEDLVSSLVSSC